MKKYIFILIFSSIYTLQAQVAIGKENVNGSNTILDFAEIGNTKGIIVPPVAAHENVKRGSTNENGIFIFDKADAKVKVFENNIWKELSPAGSSTDLLSNDTRQDIGSGVIIGAETTTAEGILVLESPTDTPMAMILPKVNTPHTSVENPYPGMICYDTATKTLAVYNGLVWTYW